MNSHYTVVYDACVMYPAPLRSFLMYLAVTGIYRARWTEQIHDEWIRNLLNNRPDLDPDKLQRTRELMNTNVPGAVVSGYEPLIGGLSLPDPDDCHVVAAAIQTRAEAIITFNLKDRPKPLNSLPTVARRSQARAVYGGVNYQAGQLADKLHCKYNVRMHHLTFQWDGCSASTILSGPRQL